MKAVALFLCVGTALAGTPPRISLDLGTVDDVVAQYSQVHKLEKLQQSKTGEHSLGYKQPDGSNVGSRQDWTMRCIAGSETSAANCPVPTAQAFDHTDGVLPVVTTIHRIDLNGVHQTDSLVSSIDYTQRATYLIFFDAQDSAGNHAEQVVFSIILDDLTPPSITACTNNAKTYVEAGTAQAAALCWSDTASDTYDGDVTGTIRYQVVNTAASSMPLQCSSSAGSWCDATDAATLIDGNTIGVFVITVRANDHAGAYGHAFSNNAATLVRKVVVHDTMAPVISLNTPIAPVQECAHPYTDPGATATDVHEGTVAVSDDAATAVDADTVGSYTVTYTSHDHAVDPENNSAAAWNTALKVTRNVQVKDTSKPTITLQGTAIVEHHSSRSNKFSDDLTDPGVNCVDACDSGCATGDCAITTEWLTTLDETTIGDYVRKYTCTDASGNSDDVERTFKIVDTDAPLIDIIGDNPLTVEASTTLTYTDPGATCEDYHHGPLTPDLSAVGVDVNRAVPGTYTLRYTCTDGEGNVGSLDRTVVVKDRTCPTLKLVGDAHVHHEAGFPYTDLGATATDTFDGVISTTAIVATYDAPIAQKAVPGVYHITYTVHDQAGNAQCATVSRTVTVEDTLPPVIRLKFQGQTVATGESGQKGHNGFTNAALMTERDARSTDDWLLAGGAAAIVGLALVAYSGQRQTLATTVPV